MIPPEKETLFRHYLDLKAAIKDLEEEIEKLKPEMTALLIGEHDETLVLEDVGIKFFLKRSAGWQYSEDLVELAAEVREMQKKEREDGTATTTTSSVSPSYSYLRK